MLSPEKWWTGTLASMAMYSTSDFRKCGQLEAIRINLDFPFRTDFMECLYPKMAFPDFMTSFRRLFMLSCCRFAFFETILKCFFLKLKLCYECWIVVYLAITSNRSS